MLRPLTLIDAGKMSAISLKKLITKADIHEKQAKEKFEPKQGFDQATQRKDQ
jgi:hypothetical protein